MIMRWLPTSLLKASLILPALAMDKAVGAYTSKIWTETYPLAYFFAATKSGT